ncbi:MAG: hypothetical protein WKG32_15035 [Gemmatimonadaceae bacterium]
MTSAIATRAGRTDAAGATDGFGSCAAAARRALAVATLLATALTPDRSAAAQLPSANAGALALGGTYTAQARGADAVAWNPAALGLPGTPRFSVAVLPTRGTLGLHQVSLGVVGAYIDTIVPVEFNRGYIARITGQVSERGTSGFEGSLVALSRGRFGMQVASLGRSIQRIAPDPGALEAFEQAGRLDFAGASYDVVVASTAALSYAVPLRTPRAGARGGALAIGATVKYTVGHALIYGYDRGSLLTLEPLALAIDFPVIESDTVFDRPENKGRGIGVDVGAAWEGSRWSAGLAVRNAVRTFRWREDEFIFRPGTALFRRDTAAAEFDALPFAHAPAELRRKLRGLRWPPSVSAGVAVRARRDLMLSGEFRRALGAGLEVEPRTHAGVSAEYRVRRAVALRAGGARVTSGYQLAGGAGVDIGAIGVSLGASHRTSPVGGATTGMLSVGYTRR